MFSSTQNPNIDNSMKDASVEPNSFTFDLERMQEAVNAPSVRVPKGLKGKDLTNFIIERAKKLK